MLGIYIVPATQELARPRKLEMKTSSASEIVHRTGFSAVKFRVWNTKPDNTTASHHCYSGITKFPGYWAFFMSYHLMKKRFCFKSEIQSFRKVKQEQPCLCFQSSSTTNFINTHYCFSMACALCCFLDEYSIHKSYSTYTTTMPQM